MDDAVGGRLPTREPLMRPEVHVAALGALVERLASDVKREANHAYTTHGRFTMAIPGGSVVPALKALLLDWDRTHIFWVDERAVPPSSRDSNFGLAEKVWLEPAGAKRTAIHRMPADDPDLNVAAVAYGEEITRVLGDTPRFDLVMLGVGPDGHVASLFPGHPALAEEHQLVLPILDSPTPPTRRLTLTLSPLTKAQRVIVMALGESKASVMQEALTRERSLLPVSLVLQRTARAMVLLDEQAGARL